MCKKSDEFTRIMFHCVKIVVESISLLSTRCFVKESEAVLRIRLIIGSVVGLCTYILQHLHRYMYVCLWSKLMPDVA